MKRVLLAFALLAAVAAGCVLSIMTEKRTTDLLIDMTDRIEEAFDAEEFDRALTLTEEFTEEFTKRTKHFTFSCGIPTSPKSRKTSSPSLSSWKPETTSIFQPNSPAAATSSISSESSNSPASIISYKNRRNGIAIWKCIKIGDTKNRVSYLYITTSTSKPMAWAGLLIIDYLTEIFRVRSQRVTNSSTIPAARSTMTDPTPRLIWVKTAGS